MSESYMLHDVIRKVKADGLFDSIRRDLLSDIEQKVLNFFIKVRLNNYLLVFSHHT